MTADRVFAKCAWRLIPFMMLLFLVNYIDRTNVGFAALTMNADLAFSPSVYGFGAGVFFLSYALFQVPSNFVLQRIGAKRWVFCILAAWGLISAANAFVQGPVSFYALRFLLGMIEAGFFPGMLLYLTYWFPQAYLARCVASFNASIPMSFVIGGPLSGLILGMDGALDLHGWQWLFLAEGIPASLLAFAVLKQLPDGPADASWLSLEEKETIAKRLAAEVPPGHSAFWPALRDPRVLACGFASFGLFIGLIGVGLWLPQIVQAMGYSNRATGFIVALPYLVSTGAMILWARSSDAWGDRIWHAALSALVAAAGFAGASLAQSDLLVIVALTFTAVGVLSTFSPLSSLVKSFLSGPAAASGLALYNAIGSVGGFTGPYIIGSLREQSGTYSSSMAILSAILVLTATIVLALGRSMARRSAKEITKAGTAE